jgi:hypothetical protein
MCQTLQRFQIFGEELDGLDVVDDEVRAAGLFDLPDDLLLPPHDGRVRRHHRGAG